MSIGLQIYTIIHVVLYPWRASAQDLRFSTVC